MLTIAEAGMLKAMKTIRENGPKCGKSGICQNVVDMMPFASGMYRTMEELFESWDMFSGSKTFPVPWEGIDPDDAYLYFKGDMWDRKTQYGRNRWALLEHCIVQLELKAK